MSFDQTKESLLVFTLSDSSGETAEAVTRAALAQFSNDHVGHYRLARVTTVEELKDIMQRVARQQGLIAYTLVRADLKETLEAEADQYGIPIIDLMGPLINKISQLTRTSPLSEAGRLHLLDESYFRRIAAIDFAIRYDDGKNPDGLKEADAVLIGVSRTSKTPNCMYLAQHWGLKAANIPLIGGIEPPEKLFILPKEKIIGLNIDPNVLLDIRCTRANILGLTQNSNYIDPHHIDQEVAFARNLFRKLGCHVIDVSKKAIEETSSEIYLYLRKQSTK